MSYLLRSLPFAFFLGLGLVLPVGSAAWGQADSPDPVEEAELEDVEGDEDEYEDEESEEAEVSSGAPSQEKSSFWTVDFESKALRMISPDSGIGVRRVFWYMLYELSNRSDEDRQVFVNITGASDHNKRYADLFLPSVERAIEKKEGRSLWGKVDEFEITSKRKPTNPKYSYMTLKAGQTRYCVAVFNRLDPNANHIKISVSGLSNEIRQSTAADGTSVLEERMREFSFERAGDEHEITLDSFTPAGRAWTLRQVPAAGSHGPGQ
jgi:hypothetical protein